MTDWKARRNTLNPDLNRSFGKISEAEYETLTFALYDDAQGEMERGNEDREVFLARWAALDAMGRIDSKRSFDLLMKHIGDDPGSTFFRVVRNALAKQSDPRLPTMIVEKGLTREAIALLVDKATPEIVGALAKVVEQAKPGGEQPDEDVMMRALIAMANAGDQAAQEEACSLLAGAHRGFALSAISSNPEATFVMVSPVINSLKGGDQKEAQTRTSLLDHLNERAKSAPMDPRWVEVLRDDLPTHGDRWVWVIHQALAKPRFESVMELLDGTDAPWPYWATLILATEGDERAVPSLLSILASKRSGYTSAELVKAVGNMADPPLDEIDSLIADQVVAIAAEASGNFEAATCLIDAWIDGGFAKPASLEMVAKALASSDFAFEYKGAGKKMLKELIARVRDAAKPRSA